MIVMEVVGGGRERKKCEKIKNKKIEKNMRSEGSGYRHQNF